MDVMKEVNFGMPKPGGPGQLSPVKLTERPGFGAPPDPNVPPPPFPVPMAEFKPQLYLKDGVLQPLGIDGVIGGSISAQAAENLTLECDIPTVNGVYADGGSVYQIRNAQIRMTGDCINDFGGNGAGLQVMGRAQVSMENSSIDTSGALRSCIMADEYASLAVKNCTLICRGGEPAPDHPGRMVPGGPGMLQAPPSMEVDGHSRLCHYGAQWCAGSGYYAGLLRGTRKRSTAADTGLKRFSPTCRCRETFSTRILTAPWH